MRIDLIETRRILKEILEVGLSRAAGFVVSSRLALELVSGDSLFVGVLPF